MKPLKILFVHGGTLKRAGTEAFMMNVFRNVDRSRVHIDFLVFGREPGDYDKEVIAAGGKIFRVPYTLNDFRIPDIALRTIKKRIISEDYDIVHSHMNALNAIILRVMRRWGIPVRISHSHGSKHFVENGLISKAQDVMMKQIPSVATSLLACSKAAGDFLYGDHPYEVINNGIDVNMYAYNPSVRKTLRKQYGLEDKYVVGHVGRFNFQKNHEFLIHVFKAYYSLNPNAHLVLVGEGELETKIKQQISVYGLDNAVTFTGVLNATHEILQAMDCFVMPSVFEGLPYVLVEAQCAGLLCLAADTIDMQTKLTDAFEFLPLEDPQTWALTLLDKQDMKRESQAQRLIDQGFDLQSNVNWLMDYYEHQQKGEK